MSEHYQLQPEIRRALSRVANLNPDADCIGTGMLRTIVAEARIALELLNTHNGTQCQKES